MSTLYKNIINKYGIDSQIIVAIEEMSELIQALSKYQRINIDRKSSEKIYNNIYEEIADVEIMINQLKIMFENTDVIEKYKREKIKRMEKLL